MISMICYGYLLILKSIMEDITMQVSDAIAQIELAEEEVVSSGLSIDIMEIKPSVATELIDGLKGRCPPSV